MINLPNGCSCSELSVHPKDWNLRGASLKVTWYISYRFYDPVTCPSGHLVQIKAGVNRQKTLEGRRAVINHLLQLERNKLLNEGFNPKTNISLPPTDALQFIEPTTPFSLALQEAHKRLKVSPRTYSDLTAIIRTVNRAAKMLGFDFVPIGDIKRKHVKLILDQVGKISKSWSAHNYNKYRTYLMILYKELLEQEAIDANIIKDISTRKKVQRIRLTLTDEQREFLNVYLKGNYYNFWLFLNIFFHSGSRITEMMLLKGSGVDLDRQKFKITVLKGNGYREVEHTIKNVALPYWQEAMKDCKGNDYVFSEGLKPGPKAIRSDQITKRWYRLVKLKLGIEADFYQLKHLNLDETASLLNAKEAAKMAAHTSTVITMNHYLTNEKERQHERLKSVDNKFA